MVVTSFHQSQGISMKLPPASTTPPQEIDESKVLTILLNGLNEISLENRAVKLGELKKTLLSEISTRHTKSNEILFNLIIHQDSDYEHYLKTLAQ